MKELMRLFNKVGGKEILRQYWHAHVLLFAITQILLNGFSKKSLEVAREAINNRILCKLRKKYRSHIAEFTATQSQYPREQSNKVWVCWFQGMENAPALVQRCFASLQENLQDREIILLTEENYTQYVQLPDYILEKAARCIIPTAQFSDLLRIALLIRYGGTWIDSTVLCSGKNIPAYMLDSDLFMFQTLKPGLDGHPTRISNWFMTACTNHPILLLTQSLLYEYWKKHNYLIDYFVFHDFFELAIEAYPDEWAQVIPFSNSTPHILLLRLFETYDPQIWEALKNMTPFHKLTYKFTEADTQQAGTYYSQLFSSVQ